MYCHNIQDTVKLKQKKTVMKRDSMKQMPEIKRTYRGWCWLSKLSINLSEELLPFECGTVCFSECPAKIGLIWSQVCPFSWSSSAKVSGFSSSPNSKRCNISSLDMVLWTCCLSTTLAASPSFVTYWDHLHALEKMTNKKYKHSMLYYLAFIYFLFHSSMSQKSISKHWLFLPIPENMKIILISATLFANWYIWNDL